MNPQNWRHGEYPRSFGRYKPETSTAMIQAINEMNLYQYIQAKENKSDDGYTEFVVLQFREGGMSDFWNRVEKIKESNK